MKTNYNEADLLAELRDLTNLKIDVVPAKIIYGQLLDFFLKLILYLFTFGIILFLFLNEFYVKDFFTPLSPLIPLAMDIFEICMLCHSAWSYFFYKHAIISNFKHGNILIKKLEKLFKCAAWVHAGLWIIICLFCKGCEPATAFTIFFPLTLIITAVTAFVINFEVRRLGLSNFFTGLKDIVKKSTRS